MTAYPVNIIETEKTHIRSWNPTAFEGYLLVPIRNRDILVWIAYNEVFAERLHKRMVTGADRDNIRYDWALLSKSVAELFQATRNLAQQSLHEGD
jgi:hypothetical protein